VNILILTVGTRGDVQPYVALGKGLAEDGHLVTIGTCVYFESFVRDHGLRYAYINNDLIDLLHSEEGVMAMDSMSNLFEVIRVGVKLIPRTRTMAIRQISDTWESTRKAKPDLILFHPKAGGAREFSERLNIPCMLAFYLPMYVPTGDVPAIFFPKLRIGRWYNKFTYRFIESATWWGTRKNLNQWRTSNGLAARRGNRFLRTSTGEVIPAIHAYSESVIPRPSDWPKSATITGYWFLDRQNDWQPSEELRRFLADGAPPVYFGFGSIFGRDPARVTRIVLEAVRTTGVRAILARGWGGLDAGELELPENVFKIENAPHDWLFPQMSAVVHHGGCGTTAAGLRAGRPTIICPFFADQPFWGARVHELGVGPKPILQKRLTIENLGAAIREVIANESMRRKADAIGHKIRAEDGVANAVGFINRWMKR